MKAALPPSIPNDKLIAKCSPRGAGNGGTVIWTSMFARGYVTADNAEPVKGRNGDVHMAYKMEHWSSRKMDYRLIDDIVVTNLFCGVGKGYDIIVCGTLVHHERYKIDAQREAEKLLDGKC